MRKLNPYYTYEIDAIESWLDEQARNGLFVTEKLALGALRFEKGAPNGHRRYRIDVKRDTGYRGEETRIAAYREMDWEYVCELESYSDVYYCDDPDAPELNTDEGTLHEVLDRRLKSTARGSVIAMLLLPAIWIWQALRNIGAYEGFYTYLSEGGLLLLPMYLLLIVSFMASMAMRAWNAAATRQRLLLARDYHTATRANRFRLWSRVHAVIAFGLLALSLLMGAWVGRDTTIPVDEFTGPSVTEFFPGHEDVQPIPYSEGILDVETSRDYFPPVTTTRLRQESYLPESAIDDTGRRRAWTYQLMIREFQISGWAQRYAAEAAEKWGYLPVTVEGWDCAWYGDTWYQKEDGSNRQHYQDLYLVKDNMVWSFYYWGETGYDLLAAAQAYDFTA